MLMLSAGGLALLPQSFCVHARMSVDFSRETLSSLMKDGVTDDLFRLMWARDELNFSPLLNIPDTVVYKYGQPVTWYFTSVNGHVKRKNKGNLISAKIEEAFTKHILGYDVIAYFISMPSDHESQAKSNVDFQTVVEYFDREGLKKFLYNHRKDVNGILQRFIEPKSTHNEVIRGIWSPKLCLLERAENIHALHDVRYGLYEKCVVYEGPDYYYTSAPLRGPVLSGQIQKLCESVVSHIGEVTFGQKQVSRIVLNFKVDSRDKIWLLYSTSIRTVDMLEYNPLDTLNGTVRNLLNIDSVISLADTVHLNPKKSYSEIKPRVRKPCLSCAREELEELRHPVTYKSIIKHYDHVLYLLKISQAGAHRPKRADDTHPSESNDIMIAWPPEDEIVESAGNVGFGCLNMDNERVKRKMRNMKDLQMPPIIAALHPKLVVDTYLRCKADPLFLNKTVHVCESCFLVYAEFQTMILQMGGNLKKLLTPDAAGVSIAVGASASSLSKSNHRPSSADWRAISSAASEVHNQSMSTSLHTLSRSASRHQQDAKSRAIGIRANETHFQPDVPNAIRDPRLANQQLLEMSMSTLRSQSAGQLPISPTIREESMFTSGPTTMSSLYRGGLLESDGQSVQGEGNSPLVYDPQDVHTMIADRERRFFKEISLNPQLKDQHPLMHLISAQQRLKLVDQQSGVLMSKTAQESAGRFGSKYGHQPGDKHDPLGPYHVEQPYVLNGEIILPSHHKQRKAQQAQDKKLERQNSIRSFLADNVNNTAAIKTQPTGPDRNEGSMKTTTMSSKSNANTVSSEHVKSSKKYRDFLSQSLKKIQGDVEGAAPFRHTNFSGEATESGSASNSPAKGSESKKSIRTASLSEKVSSRPVMLDTVEPTPVLRSQNRTANVNDYALATDFDDAPIIVTPAPKEKLPSIVTDSMAVDPNIISPESSSPVNMEHSHENDTSLNISADTVHMETDLLQRPAASPAVMAGTFLEDSSVEITTTDLGHEAADNTSEDGQSLAQSEAFAQLRCDGSICSQESAGQTLSPRPSVEADESLLLSAEQFNTSSLEASASRDLTLDQNLMKQQASILLEQPTTSEDHDLS